MCVHSEVTDVQRAHSWLRRAWNMYKECFGLTMHLQQGRMERFSHQEAAVTALINNLQQQNKLTLAEVTLLNDNKSQLVANGLITPDCIRYATDQELRSVGVDDRVIAVLRKAFPAQVHAPGNLPASMPLVASRVVIGSGREGINGQKYAIMREVLCDSILQEKLPQERILMILAPPESGKTGLLQCLLARCEVHKIPCIYVKCTDFLLPDKSIEFDHELSRRLGGRSLQQVIQAQDSLVLLIDEAQAIWDEERSNSSAFWSTIKSIDQGGGRVYVVFAAMYGNKHRNPDDQNCARNTSSSMLCGPSEIEKKSRTITVQRGEDGFTLALSQEEWLEVCNIFEQHNPHLPFDPFVKRYIFESCAGQVGLVLACLDYLQSKFKKESDQPEPELSRNAMWELTSKDFLRRMGCVRLFLRYEKVSAYPGAQAVLMTLLYADHVQMEDLNEEQRKAARKWSRVTGMIVIDDKDRIQFTSPIHKTWFSYKAYTGRMIHNDEDDSTNLKFLLQTIFQRMDAKLLQGTHCVGKDGSLLESCWGAEVYRACVMATPNTTMVSTLVGQALGAHGCGHVYIGPPYYTALEFLRNGDRLTEHLQRFKERGQYWPLVEKGVYKHYAVVDVNRPGFQTPPAMQDDTLYTAVMSDGWTHADFWHMGECFASGVQLLGDASEHSLKALDISLGSTQHARAEA